MIAFDLLDVLSAKKRLTGQEFVEDSAQGVEIAADIDMLPEDALWTHIERRAWERD